MMHHKIIALTALLALGFVASACTHRLARAVAAPAASPAPPLVLDERGRIWQETTPGVWMLLWAPEASEEPTRAAPPREMTF